MSITIDLCGGLGNQLFQIAVTLRLAEKYNLFAYFPNKFLLDQAGETDRRHTYYHLFPDLIVKDDRPKDCVEITEREGFQYQEIKLEPGKNYVLKGYFQSYKYLLDFSMQQHLKLPKSDQKRIDTLKQSWKDKLTVSLHVRHGDYLRLQHFHNILPIEYYKRAFDIMQLSLADITVVIFSDNLPWCETHFDWIPNKVFLQETDYIELTAMSICTHNIIANSSFSWWGAYLNANPGKIVVYPKKWIQYRIDISGLIPGDWRGIDV